jgi:parallel beta-helix repeat protein
MRFLVTPLLFVFFLVGTVSATAVEEGEAKVITADTVWEGDVQVAGEVIVQAEATLLLRPGTTVRFIPAEGEEEKKARLVIRGTLLAQGTETGPIVFTSAAPDPAPGDWGGLLFDHANDRPNRLRSVTVEYAANGIGGGYSLLLVEDSLLRHNTVGFSAGRDFKGGLFRTTVTGNETGIAFNQSSGVSVENCTIRDNSRQGIACVFSSSPMIRNSEITGNGEAGISCLQGSSPLIDGNLIVGHVRGITMQLKSRPHISRNEISGNETGIWAEKLVFPKILDNLITGNGVGVYLNYSAYPEIHGNNFSGNKEFALVVGDNMSIHMEKKIPFRAMGKNFDQAPERSEFLPPQTKKYSSFTASDKGIVDARGNWWGKESLEEIERLGEEGNISVIEDVHDKPDTWYQDQAYPRDRVIFAPWEKAEVVGAGRPAKGYSGVKGKVVFAGEGLPGARVHIYKGLEESLQGEGFTFSAPTGEDGVFSIHLGAGTYYLAAKKTAEGFPHGDPGAGEFFGYYGGNPLTVGEGAHSEVNIQVVKRVEPVLTETGESEGAVISGIVSGPEGPLEGASVHVYADTSRQFRGPGLFGPQGAVIGGTGPSGDFSMDIPPGKYWIVASKRAGGGFLGPLQPGDLHGWYDGNPVVIAAGEERTIVLQAVKKLKETAARGAPVLGSAGIRGKILDPSGKVPTGVYAYATKEPSFMLGGMPPFRSEPVGEDGSYVIDLPGDGTYYVGARSGYGGPPLPGEWHGFFGGDAPDPVEVQGGAVRKGVDFTVREME